MNFLADPVCVQHSSRGEQRAITNSSRKNTAARPKWKWCLVVDVSDGENVWCSKEQYCIRTWKEQKTREAWCAAVHGITKSWTRLSDWRATICSQGENSIGNFWSRKINCKVMEPGPGLDAFSWTHLFPPQPHEVRNIIIPIRMERQTHSEWFSITSLLKVTQLRRSHKVCW